MCLVPVPCTSNLCRAKNITFEYAQNRFEKLINIKDRGQIFRVDVDTIELIEASPGGTLEWSSLDIQLSVMELHFG